MLLKLFIVSVFLFETIDAGKVKTNEREVSFSIEKVWQSYKTKDKCDCKDEWKEGVQNYYDGCRKVTWKFRGPSYDIADSVLVAFEIYLRKLIYFTNSNSTVLASSSKAILDSLSKLNKLNKSAANIIKEFNRKVLGVVKEFNVIVTNLSKIIGDCTCSVNDALNDLGRVFSSFMTQFIRSGLTGYKQKVDYEPVFKQSQKLMNTVALIAETLLNNKCDLATQETEEAVAVLILVYNYFVIAVQGINSCGLDILYKNKCDLPQKIVSCSHSLEFVVVEVTQSVAAVTFPLTNSIETLFTSLVNITMTFNKTLRDILGLFEGVATTVGQITQNLSKGVSNPLPGDTQGLTNILKGVALK